jgi:glutamyl-tRNA synthetase
MPASTKAGLRRTATTPTGSDRGPPGRAEAAGSLADVSDSSPRVRFAPSPTGYLHVGGARAALFNWLFARQTGGTLVLRIEDTDGERSRPELIEAILESLTWLGIDWDEGPVFQSERRALYEEAAVRLLAEGHAYLVDAEDNPVEGDTLREGAAVRVRVPDTGSTEFDDLIRGHVVFEHENVEDFVIWRSNGTPTFLLANAVDDIDLGITHVIRGEDLLSSTPKVILLRRLLGTDELPVYAHLPLLVNESRQKLSKRRDDVAVGDYREKGYLPEAMANYLALLGWGPADGVEVRPMAEIVEAFRLEDVTKSAAFFDLKKLAHVNGEWVRGLALEDFLAAAEPWMTAESAPWPADRFDPDAWRTIAPLVQERVKTLDEAPGYVDWLFLEDPPADEKSWEKVMVKGVEIATPVLDDAITAFADIEWDADSIKASLFDDIAGRHELKAGKAQAPVRVAALGRAVGPPLFESLELLGREETVRRLQVARAPLRWPAGVARRPSGGVGGCGWRRPC